jgi:hypothetical protein
MKKLNLVRPIFLHAFSLAAAAWLRAVPAEAQPPLDAANKSAPIPKDQLGAVAGKQYQGDGLSVAATPDGARLRCAFQRLAGQVTSEGLWLSSTVAGAKDERFRVVAVAVGRDTEASRSAAFLEGLTPGGWGLDQHPAPLAFTGSVTVAGPLARFIRAGLTEEYSVSMDGVRQDFVVDQRPEGEGEVRVELEMTGAKAEALAKVARLVLNGSGRKLAYGLLRVVDARGKELTSWQFIPCGLIPRSATRTGPVWEEYQARMASCGPQWWMGGMVILRPPSF